MEHQKGSLSKGKVADMAVLSNDILSISPDKIKDVKVIMTIVGGMIVYRNDVL
ncbi:MAG TPA: amidohydrolase family protein [Spirochaetota bacterium]|nr:amidohydrolase family protein [Spirochaetota bacterium]HPD05963.1 amidohydrolase family protein [Spirochaetota bacterium]HPK45295.1 amidohydrolase family protein [Spirochaetota bacterium]HQI38182.1 amidohydrolase family protein [Spirochaetota bacterium]HRR61061.1 amidohydrolase family protein [Spirochaetota bacterium]